MGKRILQVSNISRDVRRSELKELFEKYGEIYDFNFSSRGCKIVSIAREGGGAFVRVLEPRGSLEGIFTEDFYGIWVREGPGKDVTCIDLVSNDATW